MPTLALSEDELRDLVRLVTLRQEQAPAEVRVEDVHGSETLRVQLSHSAAFESLVLGALGSSASEMRVIAFMASAPVETEFHPNFFVTQSGKTFRPDPLDTREVAYLVGEDLLMRSNSRFHEQSTILKTKVQTDTAKLALDGEEGVQFTLDYRNVEVLSAYTSIQVDEERWALLAEIDRDETLEKVVAERPTLAAIVLALYALSFGSLWFGRNLNLAGSTELPQVDFHVDDIG